jgi:N-acetylneuraminate synthase
MKNNKMIIIAEAGVNHNGSLDLALKMVEVAKQAGANAIKFQTFNSESVLTDDAPKATYQVVNTGEPGTQIEMVKKLELSEQQHVQLKKYADKLGIDFLSTPFDEGSADMLFSLGVKAFKVSSGDLVNYQLLTNIAKKGLPVILSSGMSTMEEVEFGINTVKEAGNNQVAILHCISNYPADEADCNLLAMQALKDKFNIPVGWSDHTASDVTAIMAVALGAVIIEKHFTLDKNLPGPDHVASLNPEELKRYIENIRLAQKARGDGIKRIMPSEKNTAEVAKRSLSAKRDIKAGEIITADNIFALRPSKGISPTEYTKILGKRTAVAIKARTQLLPEMIEGY